MDSGQGQGSVGSDSHSFNAGRVGRGGIPFRAPAGEPGVTPFAQIARSAEPGATGNTDVIRKLVAAQSDTGLERHRGPGRRLSQTLKSAEEGELTQEQFLFLMAMESFKKANGKAYPAWSDVLEVIRLLGYRKTGKSELTLSNAEDWTEGTDAPSNVRPARWNERHGEQDQDHKQKPRRKAA